NGTSSTVFMNPLAGRMAWTGSSAGYIPSTVQFPASLNGKTVKFRFRMGSDNSVAGIGWRVDNFAVVGDFVCCTKVTPVVTLTDSAACIGAGNVVSGTIRLTNPGTTPLTGSITATHAPGKRGWSFVAGCRSTFGPCTPTSTSVTWSGTIPGSGTLTINFLAKIGESVPGHNCAWLRRQVCRAFL